jgi:hypothetical protein
MKAQVQARILLYVLAVFIAGTILLYGYTVVKNLLITQEQVQMLDFKKGVQDQVEELAYAYRDVRENRYQLPAKYTGICFADISKSDTADKAAGYTLIMDSIQDGVNKNVFLVEGKRMADAFSVGKIEVENDFECYPVVNGQVRLRFEAVGRAVKISSW